MNETKIVTLEAFEEYHKKIIEYIQKRDGQMFDGKFCPKCGAVITDDKCECDKG